MMMAPQVVGVLLKKPGQQNHPRVQSLDLQETRIRGELYVEDLGERRIVSIRMGWLWVEGTPMRLPLRALNLRQASPSICQPGILALGFTLSNSQEDTLATFWADTEPMYWSWVRAIAAELVRQTPFRAQRCLNFLEILTVCPRSPVPLADSPTETRRRSRSEFRCWLRDSSTEKTRRTSTTLLDQDSRRRARSELRGWSSNSSDEDLLGEFRSIPSILSKEPISRTWGCSESSEGSDDSLPWGGGQSSVDSVDSISGPTTTLIPEPDTREQRIQRYKEARRRENEARSRRVLEEDAKRRRARAEEKNNNNNVFVTTRPSKNVRYVLNGNNDWESLRKPIELLDKDVVKKNVTKVVEREILPTVKLPPMKAVVECSVRFEETNNNNVRNNKKNIINGNSGISRTDSGERRSRTRERRSVRDKVYGGASLSFSQSSDNTEAVETLRERKERLSCISSRIPVPQQQQQSVGSKTRESSCPTTLPRSPTSLSIVVIEPCEEDVARLLERCQRVDHYVPVRDKLTLFESLSRLGGRLARSTEDLGRSVAKPSPRGKQRARSLHDLNRGARSVPVREMCRFFEGDQKERDAVNRSTISKTKFSDSVIPTRGS